MPQTSDLIGLGMPSALANVAGDDKTAGLTAAGTLQSDAFALTATYNYVSTAASNSGVILPSTWPLAKQIFVFNQDANTMKIWPPVGGNINNAAANAAVTLATLKAVAIVRVSATQWLSLPGA